MVSEGQFDAPRPQGQWALAWRRFKRDRVAVGCGIFLLLLVFAVGPEDWQKYVEYTQEWERPRKLHPPGRLVSDKVLTPKKAPDELVSTNVELGPALNAGLGQVLVVVEPTRTPPKGWHRAELDLWLQSTDLGVNAYVVKPVDFHEFVNAVRELGVFWAVINEPPPGSVRKPT